MTELANRPVTGPWLDTRPSRPLLHVEVTRRPADGRDTTFERDLFAESRDDLLLLPIDTRDVIVDMQFRAQRRTWRVNHPDLRHEVLLVRGVRAGHILLAEDDSTVTVVDVAVRVGLRGLGIGTDLIAEYAQRADGGHRAMHARVWSSNHGARRFFERCGFVCAGTVAGFHEFYRAPVSAAA